MVKLGLGLAARVHIKECACCLKPELRQLVKARTLARLRALQLVAHDAVATEMFVL